MNSSDNRSATGGTQGLAAAPKPGQPEREQPDQAPAKDPPDVRDPAPQPPPQYPPGDPPGTGDHVPTSPPPMG